MKIIRAMRVARARARGSSRVGETEQREERGRGESCMGLQGRKNGINQGELKNERMREED